MSTLRDIARATAARHHLFGPAAPVVAMVSGGADSTALLLLLAGGAFGERPVSALHVHHGLRGADADADADAVRALCAGLGVPCVVERHDVAALAAAEGLNLEDAGRRVRYRAADRACDAVCDAAGVPRDEGRIAVAHTLDDRAETLLMRLAQGTGAAGLLAPAVMRGRVVRPLVDATRADVLAYLAQEGVTWREDASNADTSRVRARLRADVVPVLRAVNPAFDDALRRTVTVLADEDALLARLAREAAEGALVTRDGSLEVRRDMLAGLDRALLRRVVRGGLAAAFPDAGRLPFAQVEAIVDAVADGGRPRDLGEGLRVRDRYGTLTVSRGEGQARSLAPSLLSVPGRADLGDGGVISAAHASPGEVRDDPYEALVDADRVAEGLRVDAYRDGDRMRPLGMTGTRKVQDLLTDAKVPRELRRAVPVVRDRDAIVWVAGVRMSEDHRVGPGTTRAVRLTWTPRDAGRGTA